MQDATVLYNKELYFCKTTAFFWIDFYTLHNKLWAVQVAVFWLVHQSTFFVNANPIKPLNRFKCLLQNTSKKNYWIYIKISLLLCYMIRGFKGPEDLTNCLLFNYLNKQFLRSLRSFTINKWEKKTCNIHVSYEWQKITWLCSVVPFFHLFSLVIYMKLTHLNRISHFL